MVSSIQHRRERQEHCQNYLTKFSLVIYPIQRLLLDFPLLILITLDINQIKYHAMFDSR